MGLRVKEHRKLAIWVAIALAVIAVAVWRIEATAADMLSARHTVAAAPLRVVPMPQMTATGEKLARVNGCFSCHGRDLTGGVVFSGWFGTRLVAPNLTHVVRNLSDAQLADAIRYGIKPDGTSLVDMPSYMFVRSSDSDIAAVIAFLRTLPQKPNDVGPTRWHFGGKAMLAMHLLPMSASRVDHTARGPITTPTTPYALGRYITRSQCSACHGTNLSGEAIMSSPGLRFSIKHYSLPVFRHFFMTGVPRIGHGTKTMSKEIRTRFKYLTPQDVRALYIYLTTSKPAD